ncbi:cytochrome c3 family protein [Desulfitobacterium chlororespirans]|uniref:Doubled CXXCH domain-containing protein n=1 Tax=Desulfitobacterium chlororespirans DSM 11544 TaxID=1121395 RepID=A0A1M7SEM2_9FIRM|nr:cytochrome c3 family protein [Desulfitobacterium chlororespirans]SHN56935.1 doubled CXXCH domain-containing protein [Desulfitobacterium chlororespirans DSM 11544]
MKMTSVKKVPDTKAIGVVMIVIMLFALTTLVFGCTPSTETGTKGSAETGAKDNSPEAPANDPYAVTFTWETNADCSVCHQKEQNSFADATTKAGVHSTLPCSTCHTDSALSTVHEKVTSASKTPIRLRSTKVEQATCLNCHENLESLAQKSAGTTVLTDAKGTVVNPHALPETSDHAIISCVSCHKMHTAEAVEKTAQDLCISCHHEKVFTCYTCHD